VGFGTEILFFVMLGLVVLGPKRMHSMLGFVGRAKAEFDKASREIKSQVSAELGKTFSPSDSAGVARQRDRLEPSRRGLPSIPRTNTE
jgi:Sec-independent protein translocase protein TatA